MIREREAQKRRKCAELAADLSKQWPGYQTRVTSVVVGNLGTINLREHLDKMGILSGAEIQSLAQAKALTITARIIRRHLATHQ